MDEPLKVSLIIPAHNEEDYIGECLQHVIKNSDDGFYEIIVVDNASTDDTAKIAEEFPGVQVVKEEQKGLTTARQRGFLEANGDILAFIDADTHMPKGWDTKVYETFSEEPEVVTLSGPYIYYDIPGWQRFLVEVYWHTLALPMYTLTKCMLVGGNFAIRKDVLQRMDGFDTSIAFYGEDTNIARRAHKYGKVLFKKHFKIHTSGRRFVEQGIIKTAFIYMANYISEVFQHKSVTHDYEDYR